MLREFVSTVYHLVIDRRWEDLREYFRIYREIASQPVLKIRPGKPQDQE